jgi:hypothetical protein
MNNVTHPRLIAPLSTFAVGSAAAIAVRIGYTWSAALAVEVFVVALAIGYYTLAGTKSDVGAIYGQRKDERQRHVVLRASRFAMIVMFATAYAIFLFMIASKKTYWQEDVFFSVGGVSYFLGLLIYGSHDEDANGTQRGIMTSEPVDNDETTRVIPPM